MMTMSHTAESSATYDPEKLSKAIESPEKLKSATKELGMKVPWWVTLLGHTVYALVETDNPRALARCFTGISFPQDFTANSVKHLENGINRAIEVLE